MKSDGQLFWDNIFDMYCWGSTIHGELGLGGVEQEQVLTPEPLDWSGANTVSIAACGYTHTLLLTNSGQIYSCGSNDFGQLGHDQPRKRPQLVDALGNSTITQISCGAAHSMAVNEWGQLYSWGSDFHGQLGLANSEPTQYAPKIIKKLAPKHIIQICCGKNHSLALASNGELYSWGANNYGQLGLGTVSEKIATATLIQSLYGIPISYIACGGDHSFAISTSGAVFGWGRNDHGQLGLNDQQNRSFPCQLKTLRNIRVTLAACGEGFSAFLTLDGGVLTCGDGSNGQLGHGSVSNEILPRKVIELMGSTITQLTCGRRHTLALVPSRGRVYGFGLGGAGQLGSRTSHSASTPQVVMGPWVSPSGVSLVPNNKENLIVHRIFAGGDHCFVTVRKQSEKSVSEDLRHPNPAFQIFTINNNTINKMKGIPKKGKVDDDLISYIETVFRSQACFNASFLLPNSEHFCCTSKHHGIDIAGANKIFDNIACFNNNRIKDLIFECITTDVVPSLSPSPPDVETLRIYLILPLYHEFLNAKKYKSLHIPFGRALLNLTKNPYKIVIMWWAQQGNSYVEKLITVYKLVVTFILDRETRRNPATNKKVLSYDPDMVVALDILSRMHHLNRDTKQLSVSHDIFHIAELSEQFDIQTDYINWISENNPHNFYFCNYPFLFDASAKTLLLQLDQALQMHTAMNEAATQGLFMFTSGIPFAVSQFITLIVSRENIVNDTLRELGHYGAHDLKKPLKIKFIGEEAEDAGGVRKEFFMLLLREILDPKYGMFKQYDDSRAIWFSEDSFEDEIMYFLIGLLCGLAIYNFIIINLSFPLALYKKLLGEPVTLSDLAEMTPTVASSLEKLLEYSENDVEDVFGLNFELSREVFGEVKVTELKPGGSNIPVTQDNKKEFVDLYVDFVLNKSVEKHFAGFQRGFLKVCGGRVLQLFQSYELMSVVIGNEDYDWRELENQAQYKNGYSSADKTIQMFWEVFHELPVAEKKNFLLYLTGSDRIPVQGMKAIKIIIQPTTDDRFLPVAHTCFNLLDLPRYKTKERLRYKLLQAIQQTQGFSLV